MPDGFCSQSHVHCEALPHSPPVPVLAPEVGERKGVRVGGVPVDALRSSGLVASVPSGPKYQVVAVVPGIGNVEKSCSNPG